MTALPPTSDSNPPTPAFSALVPILILLRELITAGEPVSVQPARFTQPRLLGATAFGQRTIYLDVDQDEESWLETLLHEVLHLHRGPFDPAVEEAEERLVEAATRRVMRSMLVELRAAMSAGVR
jgi:hypothetical protein